MIIGIDNGCTGSMALLYEKGRADLIPMKSFCRWDAVKRITRLDYGAFLDFLIREKRNCERISETIFCWMEKPFTNPKISVRSSMNAGRFYEAQLIALERSGIGYDTIPSSAWQKKMLPNVKGRAELKRASAQKGKEMFPALASKIEEIGDADSLLIAAYFWKGFDK